MDGREAGADVVDDSERPGRGEQAIGSGEPSGNVAVDAEKLSPARTLCREAWRRVKRSCASERGAARSQTSLPRDRSSQASGVASTHRFARLGTMTIGDPAARPRSLPARTEHRRHRARLVGAGAHQSGHVPHQRLRGSAGRGRRQTHQTAAGARHRHHAGGARPGGAVHRPVALPLAGGRAGTPILRARYCVSMVRGRFSRCRSDPFASSDLRLGEEGDRRDLPSWPFGV
eukprot:ctg_2334.g353